MAVYKILVCVILFLTFNCNASAQRTMPDQNAIRFQSTWNGTSLGAGALFSRYTSTGYWETGIVANKHIAPTNISENLEYYRTIITADYMHRIAANRKRSLNLHIGGGTFIGLESIDPFAKLPEHVETALPGHAFIYGIYASVLTEVFLCRKVALTFSGDVPLTFSSSFGIIGYCATAGCKIML